MTPTLDFKLLDKDYRVACTDTERESLLAAVTLLEGKLSEFGKVAKGGGERVAVMAALDLAHELIAVRRSGGEGFRGENEALETETIQRRIDLIEARIAAALG